MGISYSPTTAIPIVPTSGGSVPFSFFLMLLWSTSTHFTYQGGRCLSHEQFRIELTKDLLAAAYRPAPTAPPATTPPSRGHHPEVLHPLSRLHDRHFPGQLGKTAGIQQDCTVCSKRKGRGRKTTTYCCKQCQLPMCVVPCFTKADPQRYL